MTETPLEHCEHMPEILGEGEQWEGLRDPKSSVQMVWMNLKETEQRKVEEVTQSGDCPLIYPSLYTEPRVLELTAMKNNQRSTISTEIKQFGVV